MSERGASMQYGAVSACRQVWITFIKQNQLSTDKVKQHPTKLTYLIETVPRTVVITYLSLMSTLPKTVK